MVHGHSCKERPLVHLGEKRPERGGRDPRAPMLPPVPVGDLAQALANDAADVPDNGALALDGAEDSERVRENPRQWVSNSGRSRDVSVPRRRAIGSRWCSKNVSRSEAVTGRRRMPVMHVLVREQAHYFAPTA